MSILADFASLQAADKLKIYIDIAGILVTAGALVFAGLQFRSGVAQYRRDQIWRRKEYVAREYEKLIDDPRADAALLMLDWSARYVALQQTSGTRQPVRVDSHMLGRALIPHTLEGRPQWTPDETAIRDCFDVLLERLETFEAMVSENLIQQADIEPHLRYWLDLIGGVEPRRHPLSVIRNLHLYIRAYNFAGACALAKRFQVDVQPAADALSKLQDEITAGDWDHAAASTQSSTETPPPKEDTAL